MERYQKNRRRCYPSKSKINKKKLAIFLIIITTIVSYYNVIKIGKKISPGIIRYANIEAKRIATLVINESVNEVVDKTDLEKNLLKLNKNEEDEIQLIDFNTQNVNILLKKVSEAVQDRILKLEDGEDVNLPVGKSIKGASFKNVKSGIVCEIKGGSLFGEILFANTGPSIPIKLSFIGEVLTSIRTNIKSYGLNNAYLEVDIEVKITERITMPISTKDVTIIKNIPIAMKIIQGSVPNYYNESLERLSESYSLPLTE